MFNRETLGKPISLKMLGIFTVSVTIFGIFAFLLRFVVSSSEVPVTHLPPAAVMAEATQIDIPIRIKIPSIAVDAVIEQVMLTDAGAMDVPKDPVNTGWYQLGARPGEIGSAAIAGHVDWWDDTPAVFANLHKLKPGDTITIQDHSGLTIDFIVRKTRKFDPTADTTEVFSSQDDTAHLNLVTCSGTWDRKAHQYSERLVVFADKVSE